MKKSPWRWLLNPLLVLVTATCGDMSQTGLDTRCFPGVDTDGDSITDDVECQIGSDPMNSDTDGDGVSDGKEFDLGSSPTKIDSDDDGIPDSTELAYPKICVATDRNAQRRPAASCQDSTQCSAGETCNGLDPTKADTDGDGVNDGVEDQDFNGTIATNTGETDPRLLDTDGDGVSDKDSGSKICRADGLGMVNRKPLPGQSIQLGSDPIFGDAKVVSGTNNSAAAIVDDAATGVAGLVIGRTTATANLAADRTAIESAIESALTAGGATVLGIFVGRQFTTHELNAGSISTFRVTRAGTSASALRDSLVMPLIGASAPGGATAGPSGIFTMDVAVVRREGINDIIVTIAPSADYDDGTKQTLIRANDLFNASGVAIANKDLSFVCQGIVAQRRAMADIVWTVDVSGSMDGTQVRLTTTARQFFTRLQNAGVDFRVGVFEGGSVSPNLQSTTQTPGFTEGFKWIPGTAVDGDYQLCRQVTAPSAGNNGFCPADLMKANDSIRPYGPDPGSDGGNFEQPVAQAVLLENLFTSNLNNVAITNPEWKWRDGATKVAFMVTDEPGNNTAGDANDFDRYFDDQLIPGTTTRWAPSATYDASVKNAIVKYFRDNKVQLFGMVPVRNRLCSVDDKRDLPRCVIEAAGGAYINVATAADADVQAAMNKLVDAIAGAASQFKLTRTPITSTIKVNIGGIDVPRSRSNGFDYDPVSKSVVFYGSQFRPDIGAQVFISYRVWTGSVG